MSRKVDVKQILHYPKGTLSSGLQLFPAFPHHPFSLRAFHNVDWAVDPDDHRSTSRAAIYYSCKQTV